MDTLRGRRNADEVMREYREFSARAAKAEALRTEKRRLAQASYQKNRAAAHGSLAELPADATAANFPDPAGADPARVRRAHAELLDAARAEQKWWKPLVKLNKDQKVLDEAAEAERRPTTRALLSDVRRRLRRRKSRRFFARRVAHTVLNLYANGLPESLNFESVLSIFVSTYLLSSTPSSSPRRRSSPGRSRRELQPAPFLPLPKLVSTHRVHQPRRAHRVAGDGEVDAQDVGGEAPGVGDALGEGRERRRAGCVQLAQAFVGRARRSPARGGLRGERPQLEQLPGSPKPPPPALKVSSLRREPR